MARHMRNGRDYSRPGPKVDYELRKDSNNAARSGEVYDKIEEIQSQIVPFDIKEVLHVASTTSTATDYTTEPLDDYDFFIVSCGVLGFRPGTLYHGSPTGFYSKAELLDTSNYNTGTQLKLYDTDGEVGPRITNIKYVNNTTIKLWYGGSYPSEVRIYGIKCPFK